MTTSRISKLDRIIVISFLLGIIPALYPIFVYIDNRNFERPLILLIAMACLHIILLVRSYYVIVTDDKTARKFGKRKNFFNRWQVGLRLVWKWHLAFGVLRFGLVIAFFQLLHSSPIGTCYKYGLNPYCYWSCNTIGGVNYQATYPFIQVTGAVFVLLTYSLLEAGLSSAFINIVLIKQHRIFLGEIYPVLYALFLRLCIALLGLFFYRLFIVNGMVYQINIYKNSYNNANIICGSLDEENFAHIVNTPISQEDRNQVLPRVLLDNLAIIPFTLIDNGTLLSVDLMRQSWSWLAIVQRLPAILGGLLSYFGVIWLMMKWPEKLNSS